MQTQEQTRTHTELGVYFSKASDKSGRAPNNLLLANYLSRHNGHAKLEDRHSWPRTWECTKMKAMGINRRLFNNYNQLGQLVNDWSTWAHGHGQLWSWYTLVLSRGFTWWPRRWPEAQRCRSHPIPIRCRNFWRAKVAWAILWLTWSGLKWSSYSTNCYWMFTSTETTSCGQGMSLRLQVTGLTTSCTVTEKISQPLLVPIHAWSTPARFYFLDFSRSFWFSLTS